MRHVISLLGLALAACPAPTAGPDGGVPRNPTTLAINEVMTSNAAALQDKDLQFDDWIELYNLTASDIALDGFTLADGAGTPAAFIAGAIVPTGGFLVVFADDDVDQGIVSEPHFPFKLSAANGDTVTLADGAGNVVDALTVPALTADTSFGSTQDGSADADILAVPSPGASNGG